MSDAGLVGRLKEEAPGAFEELVQQYSRRLLSVSFRILGNKQDAEDVTQETFLRVYQSIETFRGESSLYTWLYRIATNESLARVRERSRFQEVDVDQYVPRFEHGQPVEPIRDWTRFPDLILDTQELTTFYETCIDDLPQQYRAPYILKGVERLSEEEVAQLLDLTKPTIKSRVHRARLVIRKRVEEYLSGTAKPSVNFSGVHPSQSDQRGLQPGTGL